MSTIFDRDGNTTLSHEDLEQLDEHDDPRDRRRILFTAGMGFFTDAYDLFIIGLVVTILQKEWGVGGLNKLLLSSGALLTAAVGACVFGRLADKLGRRSVYGWEMLVLAAGAIASALSPSVWWLIGFRAILGFGVGGDYPVSSTIMSEYAGRRNRGRMVALVFSSQGIGLVVGPLLAVILLAAGISPSVTWRLLLAAGAIPALSVFYLRRRVAETPRFRLLVQHREEAEGTAGAQPLRESVLFTSRKLRRWLFAISATWFLFDFAYYGDTIGSSQIVKKVVSHASVLQTSAINLAIFAIFSLPAFYLAAFTIDRIGRKTMQMIGFLGITAGFAILATVPTARTETVLFIIVFGATYFFSQFGPNTTTFVFPSEIFPVSVRTTGDGIAAGIAKLGAFAGAAVLPALLSSLGLATMVIIPAGVAALGAMVTLLLPEPKGQSLESLTDDPILQPRRGASFGPRPQEEPALSP
ncbi:MAG TPA: MFS transporter [Solirubrobacteraceae bacterium]|nr:MFS transporter [Solirubrobacteraceae bacterium]